MSNTKGPKLIYCCINCGNLIHYTTALYGTGICCICYRKTLKGIGNPNYGNGQKIAGKNCYWYGKTGNLNPNYNPNKIRNYYCIDCNKEISIFSGKYGDSRCLSCAGKFKCLHNFPKGKLGGLLSGYYKNIWMKSSFEIKFAQFLDLSKIKWLYEPKRFLIKNESYLPDFYLSDFDCYVEIKGWFRNKDKKRYNLFLKNYPQINIQMLFQKDLEYMGIL